MTFYYIHWVVHSDHDYFMAYYNSQRLGSYKYPQLSFWGGYNPYFEALKLSFFIVVGSKGIHHIQQITKVLITAILEMCQTHKTSPVRGLVPGSDKFMAFWKQTFKKLGTFHEPCTSHIYKYTYTFGWLSHEKYPALLSMESCLFNDGILISWLMK